MVNKTRKVRNVRILRGGEFLGEGAQGKTYNAGCVAFGESFCKILKDSPITEITVYTEKDPVVLTRPADIAEFVEATQGMSGAIAKLFKHKGQHSTVAHKKLLDEIRTNQHIKEIYGADAEHFTTVAPLRFQRYDVYGVAIHIDKQPDIYAVFGRRCDNKYHVEPRKLLIDILASLIILNERGYYHNDIKLDNIVRCKDMYTLIDWGASTPIHPDEKTHGSLLTTSPMRWYLFGYNQFISTSIIGTKTYYVNQTIYKSPIFQENVARINREFYNAMKKSSDRATLFAKYKESFDVFMLGMTALHSVIVFNLDYKEYKPIIEQLTSLEAPINAKEALRLVSKIGAIERTKH